MLKIKRSLLFLFFVLSIFNLFSQNQIHYFVEIKVGYDLGIIQSTTNSDQTLTFTMSNTDFAAVLNAQPIYTFEKGFPTTQRPLLQRVYLLSILEGSSVTSIEQREEVENVYIIDDEIILQEDTTPTFGIIPNDYDDIMTGGRNTALDLIKAPLAWRMSTGENVIVGVADTKIDQTHQDLQGQIIAELNLPPDNRYHGTGVSGIIAAKTDNNKYVASIAHDSKIIAAPRPGNYYVLLLSWVLGVKVINCSWTSCSDNPVTADMYKDIADRGIVVVAAAGNNDPYCAPNAYRYPASYESVFSVTSVGNRFPIGFDHNIINPDNGNVFLIRSWKDVHLLRPQTNDTTTHTHNDKVDVSAPGHLITNITDDYTNFPDGIKILPAGTSASAPYVSGLAALILSVNPSLTPAQVKDIIRTTTDDIYHISYNQPYIGQLGTGRINAYRAVLTADCMVNPSTNIDLAMQDSKLDYFEEPDNNTLQPWRSEDIWVRNQIDEDLIDVHQNPEYDPNNPNYAYVRVTNNSCVTSSGNDQLKLYWAKANSSLAWPASWDGTRFIEDPVTHEDILMGDEVGTLTIPQLEIGESTVLQFE